MRAFKRLKVRAGRFRLTNWRKRIIEEEEEDEERKRSRGPEDREVLPEDSQIK